MGIAAAAAYGAESAALEKDFVSPPASAKPWCYWWWLNGCVTQDGIVRDLDHMQAKGISGALVFHAGEGETPFRIEFMSPRWRELFKFAVAEAARRQIVVGFNVCGGWNAGGPWVRPEKAAQTLGFRAAAVRGPRQATLELPPFKPARTEHYGDIAVLAWRFTAPVKGKPAVCQRETMTDLTAELRGDQLTWDAPAGKWVVVRFGHYVHPRAHTKCTGGGRFLEIDPLRADVMDRHFAATAGALIADLPEYVGKTFQYVHIDSGEIGKPDWTPALREEFQKRRGYDPFPYLAARAGMIVDNPETSERFNEDYERTLGDLMVENYYGRLAALARRHGLGAHSEAVGFQKPCVDALRSLGVNDICMSEFWARRSDPNKSYIHQLSAEQVRNHDGIKTAAAAAHAYGRRIVMAEAYTVMNRPPGVPNYDKDPYAFKDVGDRAFCAGLNRVMLCFMVHQPEETSKPGYEWPSVGAEFNRHVTWWPMGGAWLTYLARCQSLLQAGQFAADVCYFPGEWVPNYVPARWAMHPELPSGYDCDTVNAEILCKGKVGEGGRLELASGMQYGCLVLSQGGRWRPIASKNMFPGMGLNLHQDPEQRPALEAGASQPLAVSPATLARIKTLVEDGMTLVGPPPARAVGLTDCPHSDAEVARLADALWGPKPAAVGQRTVGKGRVIWGQTLAEIFAAERLKPDLEIKEDAASARLTEATLNGVPNPTGSFDWIHRRVNGTDVYFIANLRSAAAGGEFTFRAAGRQPELWDAVSGERRDATEWRVAGDRTVAPLQFAPRQSWFIVFRRPAAPPKAVRPNFPALRELAKIEGPWQVSFDPKWGGPERVTFDKLEDWTKRPEDGVRYYSGTATYRNVFPWKAAPADARRVFLDLGVVKNIARVRLNGRDLGVVWTAPWRVEITGAVKAGANELKIEVANLWPNRLIGDAALPKEKRLTVTNVRAFEIMATGTSAGLLSSGLLGPVTLRVGETAAGK